MNVDESGLPLGITKANRLDHLIEWGTMILSAGESKSNEKTDKAVRLARKFPDLPLYWDNAKKIHYFGIKVDGDWTTPSDPNFNPGLITLFDGEGGCGSISVTFDLLCQNNDVRNTTTVLVDVDNDQIQYWTVQHKGMNNYYWSDIGEFALKVHISKPGSDAFFKQKSTKWYVGPFAPIKFTRSHNCYYHDSYFKKNDLARCSCPYIEERINFDPQTNLHHWWGWSSHRIVFIFVGNITYVFDAPYADMQLGSSLHGMLSFRADDSHEWSSEDYAEFTQVYFHNNAAAICMKEENIRINDQIDGKIIDAERVLIKPEYVECYPFSGFALIKPTDETGAKNEKIH